jgi:hypothetical protein
MHDNDDLCQGVIKKAWNHIFQGQSNNHLLLGLTIGNVDLSASHPSQVQIFKLWRIYLDNVNPLLKVTHAPTLQTRIIDAANNISSLSPTLEALIFSIYRVSILSLADDECTAVFGVPKKDLLTGYQFACRQALQNCDLLQSSNRDCLTALYLYLVSLSDFIVPLYSNCSRYLSGPTRTPRLCPHCSALLYGSLKEWVFTTSLCMVTARL